MLGALLVHQWHEFRKGRGKVYAVLADLVRWRKDTKFTGTVPLNEAVLAAETSTVDYQTVIEEVLDGLLVMTEGNWEDKREELADLLRGASEQYHQIPSPGPRPLGGGKGGTLRTGDDSPSPPPRGRGPG